jgi:hypothetical protein
MGIIYKVSAKELLDIRNKIVLQTAIPSLLKRGFSKSPFSTAWYGRNNLQDFSYELCRLTTNSQLEVIEIYVARGDKWIKFNINVFKLIPFAESIEQLNNLDGLQFKLPPNSISEMRLRSDDIKGPPIFNLNYISRHKLKRFFTMDGLTRSIKLLTETIEADLKDINHFVKRWHELHYPMTTNWTGKRIVNESADK